METWRAANGCTYTLYAAKKECVPLIVVLNHDGTGRGLYDAIHKKQLPAHHLLVVQVKDWDRDLSPWPAVIETAGQKQVCRGKAADFLRQLEEEIQLLLYEGKDLSPKWAGICGYSMAGLFALWSLYANDLFASAACVSGSVWYPGFVQFAKTAPFNRETDPMAVYFSLGNTETRTHNPMLQKTDQIMEELCALYETKGMESVFEWNSGNHFQDVENRQIKAIRWLLKHAKTPAEI